MERPEELRGWDALEGWGGGEEGGGVGAARGRKTQDEGAALSNFAEFELERAAVPLGELAADEETEPGARLGAEAGIIDPEEALEDLVLLIARDADAAVLDDQRGAAVGDHGQLDPGPSGAVGERVVDQVVDDAGQLLPVRRDRDRLIGLAIGHFRTEQSSSGLGAAEHLTIHLTEVELLCIRCRRAALYARVCD